MRLLTGCRKYVAAVIMLGVAPTITHAQLSQSNPQQVIIIEEGEKKLNDETAEQTKGMQETAAVQGAMAAEYTAMKGWEEKYNSYLKTTRGYAESIKAGTTLYADGVETLRNLHDIYRAINDNPEGIGATIVMNSLYLETAAEFTKTYRLLKTSVAKGGKYNMLNGAERTQMMWQLSDNLAELNAKLRLLSISIAYYNFKDAWKKATAGMINRTHGEIAADALDRWKRASELSLQ